MSYVERCPECGALGKIDEEQFLGKVSIECSGCRHHYHREKAMIKLKTIRVKYLRKGGTRSTTFWSEREVGQVIKEDAFEGMIDEVLEIEGISDTTEKSQYVCKNCGKEYPFNKVNVFHSPPRCPYCLSTWIVYVGLGLEPPDGQRAAEVTMANLPVTGMTDEMLDEEPDDEYTVNDLKRYEN